MDNQIESYNKLRKQVYYLTHQSKLGHVTRVSNYQAVTMRMKRRLSLYKATWVT